MKSCGYSNPCWRSVAELQQWVAGMRSVVVASGGYTKMIFVAAIAVLIVRMWLQQSMLVAR